MSVLVQQSVSKQNEVYRPERLLFDSLSGLTGVFVIGLIGFRSVLQGIGFRRVLIGMAALFRTDTANAESLNPKPCKS